MPRRKYGKSTRRAFLKRAGCISAAALACCSKPAIIRLREISIISSISGASPVAMLRKIASSFEMESGTKVVVSNMDHESHKTAIRNYLVAGAPDVCFWFSGNRMRSFVKRGLFDDISDLYDKEKYRDVLGVTTAAVTVDGRQFGLPIGGWFWGMFYRKDVFDEHGLSVPTTWEQLLIYGKKAKDAGLIPICIGTKELWPAAGFFDHLSLRINGLEKHYELMNGQMSYKDASLNAVFDHWQALISEGFFTPNHTSFGWQEAAAFLVQKRAGMMNMAGIIKLAFPENELSQLAFSPFPNINPAIGRFEEFSIDSIHIPARAKNKEAARDFLAYFYRPENLSAFLGTLGMVPPRLDLPPSDDPLINIAVESLRTVDGTSQYYDRDTDPDMAQAGLNGFQEFMAKPERRGAILQRLEDTRIRIFNSDRKGQSS